MSGWAGGPTGQGGGGGGVLAGSWKLRCDLGGHSGTYVSIGGHGSCGHDGHQGAPSLHSTYLASAVSIQSCVGED